MRECDADVTGPYYTNSQMMNIQKGEDKSLEGVVDTFLNEINLTNMRELFALTQDVTKDSGNNDANRGGLSSNVTGNKEITTQIYWVSTVEVDSDETGRKGNH